MFVIFCAWSSFITIKYNCTMAKLTPYRVLILFAKLSKCYIFSLSNLVHESAIIQDLFRCFFHFTLGGYQMVAQGNFIWFDLNLSSAASKGECVDDAHKGSTGPCNRVLSLSFPSLGVFQKIVKTNSLFWSLHHELQRMHDLYEPTDALHSQSSFCLRLVHPCF